MTRLIPDDWARAGGRCPASGPDTVWHPGSYPIRGVVGSPRLVIVDSRSPYAAPITDTGPGVGADINEILRDLEGDLKRLAIAQAAAVTAISIAALAVPVVGWAVGAIVSVVQAISAGKYKAEMDRVIADTQAHVQQRASEMQLRLTALQERVFDEEKDSAIRLALSDGPLPEQPIAGLNGWNPMREISRFLDATFGTPLRQAMSVPDKIEDAMKDAWQTLTGKKMVDKAIEASKDVRAEADRQIQETEQVQAAKIQGTAFRSQIRLATARKLREDPGVAALLAQRDTAKRGQQTTVTAVAVVAVIALASGAWWISRKKRRP